MKSKLNLKHFGLCLTLVFFLASCEKDESSDCDHDNSATNSASSDNASSRRIPPKNNLIICHYDNLTNSGSLLTIRPNQWYLHTAHGDVRLDDADGDGYVPNNSCGYSGRLGAGDCNEGIGWIYPGAPEICGNDFDENCNGDEDDPCPVN